MNTNTYEQLEQLYAKFAPGSMQADIVYYMQHGYVFVSPEYIVMGQTFASKCYVHAAVGVGALEKLLQHLPVGITQVGWERRDRGIRWYNVEKLKRKLYGKETSKSLSSTSCSCNGVL